jgi:type IV pilus assembly protein PilQ
MKGNFKRIRGNQANPMLAVVLMVILAACATGRDSTGGRDLGTVQELNTIHSISSGKEADGYSINIQGDGQLAFTSVKQPFPLGVILYFPDTILEGIADDIPIDNTLVEGIKTSELTADGHTSRIEILLKNDASYQVQRREDGLTVVFQYADTAVSASAESIVAEQSQPEPPLAESSLEEPEPVPTASESEEVQPTPAAAPTTVPKAPPASPVTTTIAEEPVRGVVASEPKGPDAVDPAWMNRIDFSSEEGGKSVLIVGTTVPVQYNIQKISPTRLELKLIDTKIPKYRQRPLITTRFESAVNRILPYQSPDMRAFSAISIELREVVPYFVEQTDNIIMVHFESSKIPPKPLESSDLPAWRRAMNGPAVEATIEARQPESVPSTAPDLPQPDATAATMGPGPEAQEYSYTQLGRAAAPKRYTGEKIALDFYKTDIKNVFRILREVSGKNFAIDKDVEGSVTLTLDKPVPWDQVLDLVLKMNQLGMVYEADVIRVATLDTLKKEEELRAEQVAAVRKAQEEKKAVEPLITEYIAVNYSNAKTEVMPHIEKLLTKERGSVSVDERNNQIIITDIAAKIREAKELVKRIDKVTPQVIIEARVVEVSSSFSRELGIEWNTQYGPGYNSNLDVDATGSMAMNFPVTSNSSVGFSFSRVDGIPFMLNAKLNALETNGNGKILSAPKILTLDNKKAMIKQGIEVPYLERDDSGGSSVHFKEVDLLLEVTPHVTPDDRISMSIFITKNDMTGTFEGVPVISTNEAETELLINDGDTIVIGGIIKSTKTEDESGFPILSQIPLLGWFFKNQTKTDKSNELLIFMTPRIVQLEQREAVF